MGDKRYNINGVFSVDDDSTVKIERPSGYTPPEDDSVSLTKGELKAMMEARLNYVGIGNVASVTAYPTPGSYNFPITVQLACATPGAVIRYTVDNSEPTISSPIFPVELELTETTIIKAKAFADGKFSSTSNLLFREITGGILSPLTKPVVSIVSGSFTTGNLAAGVGTIAGPMTISLADTTGDAIRYMLDGSTPTMTSPLYTGSIVIDGSNPWMAYKIRAVSVRGTSEMSEVSSLDVYYLDPTNAEQNTLEIVPVDDIQDITVNGVDMDYPWRTWNDGTQWRSERLIHTDLRASIFYTTDGSDPSCTYHAGTDSLVPDAGSTKFISSTNIYMQNRTDLNLKFRLVVIGFDEFGVQNTPIFGQVNTKYYRRLQPPTFTGFTGDVISGALGIGKVVHSTTGNLTLEGDPEGTGIRYCINDSSISGVSDFVSEYTGPITPVTGDVRAISTKGSVTSLYFENSGFYHTGYSKILLYYVPLNSMWTNLTNYFQPSSEAQAFPFNLTFGVSDTAIRSALNGKIAVTIDGSNPDYTVDPSTGLVSPTGTTILLDSYNNPSSSLTINGPCTVKARIALAGWDASGNRVKINGFNVYSKTYTTDTVNPPTVALTSGVLTGGSIASGYGVYDDNLYIQVTPENVNDTVRRNMLAGVDGSFPPDPTTSSSIQNSTPGLVPFDSNDSFKFKWRSFRGTLQSTVKSLYLYRVRSLIDFCKTYLYGTTTDFTSGTYTLPVSFEMRKPLYTSADLEYGFYYTTDGSVPTFNTSTGAATGSATKINSGQQVTINSACTVKTLGAFRSWDSSGNRVWQPLFGSNVTVTETTPIKGYICGGYTSSVQNTIDIVNFSTQSTALSSSTLVNAVHQAAGVNSFDSGYICGGGIPTSVVNYIQKILYSTVTTSTLAGVLHKARKTFAGVNSELKGWVFGGYDGSTVNSTDSITFATDAVAQTGSGLSGIRSSMGACNSDTKGYMGGGSSGSTFMNIIDYVTFNPATTGTLAATLHDGMTGLAAFNSQNKGYFGAGHTGSSMTDINATALNFSNESVSVISNVISVSMSQSAGIKSDTYGYFVGGYANGVPTVNSYGIRFSDDTTVNHSSWLKTTSAKSGVVGIQSGIL